MPTSEVIVLKFLNTDYRGISTTECKKITPYNNSGNNIDPAFQCKIISSSTGYEKVKDACSVANGNPILCEKISKKK